MRDVQQIPVSEFYLNGWILFWTLSIHTAKATALLQEFFREHIAGHGIWPPRSPDLPIQTYFCRDFWKKEFIKIILRN
jgi:hypothetical protein